MSVIRSRAAVAPVWRPGAARSSREQPDRTVVRHVAQHRELELHFAKDPRCIPQYGVRLTHESPKISKLQRVAICAAHVDDDVLRRASDHLVANDPVAQYFTPISWDNNLCEQARVTGVELRQLLEEQARRHL